MGELERMKLIIVSLSLCLALIAQAVPHYEIRNPVGADVLASRIRASYGFLSQREPALNSTEYAIIDKFLPFLEEDPDFAIEMIQGLTKNNPNLTASFHLTLGNLHFQTADLTSARESYAIAVEKYPDYLRAWKAIGLLEMHEQNYQAAKKSLGTAVRLGDSDPDTFGLIAYAFYIEEDYLAALSAYSHALLFAPESEEWIQGKVACLLNLEDFRPARTILEAITKKKPKNQKHWTVLANVYLSLKQPLKAAAVLEYLRQEDLATPQHSTLLTTIYLDNELPELAAKIFLHQIDDNNLPDSTKLIACLFELSNSGQGKLATKLMLSAQRSNQFNDPKYRYALLRYQGETAMRNQQYDEAKERLSEALELSEERGPVLLQLGINQHMADLPEEAIDLLEEATIYPAVRLRALVAMGQIMMARGEHQTAIRHLQMAIDEGASSHAQKLYEQALHAARKQEFDRLALRTIKQF